MQQFVKTVSGEANLPLVPEEQLEFTMKLYDLNQVSSRTLGHRQLCAACREAQLRWPGCTTSTKKGPGQDTWQLLL